MEGRLGTPAALARGAFSIALLRTIAKEQGRSVVIVSHDQRIQEIAERMLWLIHYELSDSVCLPTDACPSGHPFALIDDIQGREQDVLSFREPLAGW